MDSKEFFSQIIGFYNQAQNAVKDLQNPMIIRGRSHSIASMAEDLLAFYLVKNIKFEKRIQIYVDKAFSFYSDGKNRAKTIYPDIVIIKNNVIKVMIDLKIDLGYKRELKEFIETKNELIAKIRNKEGWYKNKIEDKVKRRVDFSKKLKLKVVVVSNENISTKQRENNQSEITKNKNIEFYYLSSGIHPNEKKKGNKKDIKINEAAFKKLVIAIENEIK